MSTSVHVDQLDVVAVVGCPDPADPLRPLRAIFRFRDAPQSLLWSTRVEGPRAFGMLVDASVLEAAEADGVATRLAHPLRARGSDAELVASATGVRYIERTERVARETAGVLAALKAALEAWHAGQRDSAIDAFDKAALMSRHALLPAALRAGAANLSADVAWRAACIDDLMRVVDYQGASLASCQAHLMWRSLPHRKLLQMLLDEARRAVEDASAPAAALEPPVPAAVKSIAMALALYRRERPQWSARLATRDVVAAVRGEPDAISKIDATIASEPAWIRCKAYAAAIDPHNATGELGDAAARAELADLARFATTLYTLEVSAGERDRRGAWLNFCGRMAGSDAGLDAAPWRAGERIAIDARARLGLDGERIRGLGHYAEEQAGVFVATMAAYARHDCASAAPRNTPPCVFFARGGRGQTDDQLRYRFAIAHELGHLLVDRHHSSGWVCSTTEHDRSRQEKQANAFAAYFLAPRHAVRELVSVLPDLASSDFIAAVARVRSYFGLSTVAAAEHLLNCHDARVRDPLPPAMRGELSDKLAHEPVDVDESGTLDADSGDTDAPLRAGRYQRLVSELRQATLISDELAASLLA